ncbi:hypothetical protein GGS23DRAFT_596654 [Durotheca rogersii]|uniref:uncharacterized protein n=1 Tax=Durotheca rogersii TaxID=419775 RepID=UPI002220EA6D|nr:uncharacterized protein GGS23DRAFT_596654 [Durotheca rogersii]KAI5863478.1 hypothetical protein GGS23DRAFT_596654 [Durotheca rogersii]
MSDYLELELKSFQLSSEQANMSLSVTALALISNIPPSQYSPEELRRLIDLKRLWLVSPGLCRIQIIIDQSLLCTWESNPEVGFLEYLADAICQCSLWPTLGLTIKQEDIQYQPSYEGAPNLYFIVEHLNKYSSLLSPPHISAAYLNGIECLFQYRPSVAGQSNMPCAPVHHCSPEQTRYTQIWDLEANPYQTIWLGDYYKGLEASSSTTRHSRHGWEEAVYLARMALYVTIGIRKRIYGLRLLQVGLRPSLLELAPTVWNAHYLKVGVLNGMSAILSTSAQAQSPSLRKKVRRLLVDSSPGCNPTLSINATVEPTIYQNSIQERLWDLLRTTLTPTIRIGNVSAGGLPRCSELGNDAHQNMSSEADKPKDVELELDVPINGPDDTNQGAIGLHLNSISYLPLLQYPEYQLANGESILEATERTRHWHRYEDEYEDGYENGGIDPGPMDESPKTFGIVDDPFDSLRECNSRDAFFDLSAQTRERPHDPSFHQENSGGLIIDRDGVSTSDYFHDVDTIQRTREETSSLVEVALWDDTHRYKYEFEDDHAVESEKQAMMSDYQVEEWRNF